MQALQGLPWFSCLSRRAGSFWERGTHRRSFPSKVMGATLYTGEEALVSAEMQKGGGEAGRQTLALTCETGVVLSASLDHVQEAVAALRSGKVIAVPTDTLYGLAADACSEEAVKRIYAIKGRSSKNPLAVCLANTDEFGKYSVTSHLPSGLLEELFPGPVTAVLQRGDNSLLDESLNPGLTSIGIRVPDSDFIRQVAQDFGGALALTSANSSGQASSISIQEFEKLWEHCTFIFDAGQLPASRAGSTVVDLTVPGMYKILREGSALVPTAAVLERYGLLDASHD